MSFSINLSKARRGNKINKQKLKINVTPRVITNETKLLISSRARGISVKVFDKQNNLINAFPTIRSAALHFGVSHKTISNIFKTGKSYDDYVYKFEVNDTRIWIYDKNRELINVLGNLNKTSVYYNIPSTTMHRYIKSGKLYKNKFFFVLGKDS